MSELSYFWIAITEALSRTPGRTLGSEPPPPPDGAEASPSVRPPRLPQGDLQP